MSQREDNDLEECQAEENISQETDSEFDKLLDNYFAVDPQWGFLVTSFRSGWLDLGTAVLAFIVFLLGLAPNLLGVGSAKIEIASAAMGLLLAGLVIGASHKVLGQLRAVGLKSGTIIEYTYFQKWFKIGRERILADLGDISTVYLAPKVDLWSHYHDWVYPVTLLTRDGRSITMVNQMMASDRELAIRMATRLAALLGCKLYIPDERVAVQVVRQGREFAIQPKDQDLGFLGRLVVWGAVTALGWGLWKLWTMV